MNFKIGDKVVLSQEGKKSLLSRDLKNACGTVQGIGTEIHPTSGRMLFVQWKRSRIITTAWNNHAVWSINIALKKPKSHNHPLTSIFAEKMPKTTSTKRRLTKP